MWRSERTSHESTSIWDITGGDADWKFYRWNIWQSRVGSFPGQCRKGQQSLGLDPNGEVGLVLTSRDGNRRLYLTPDERTVIKLTDQDGQMIWSAP
jgi:hypothetical protein